LAVSIYSINKGLFEGAIVDQKVLPWGHPPSKTQSGQVHFLFVFLEKKYSECSDCNAN